jgi:hypothetical protein
MKRWFRPRPGVGNDVVYEIKGLVWFLVPATFGIGFREFANAAAKRNRISHKLNEMSLVMERTVEEFGRAEAELKAERDDLAANRYNHLGVGRPFLSDPKSFKDMLPYVSEPKPEWKAFVAAPVWKRILRENNVGDSGSNPQKTKTNSGPQRGRTIISPSDAVDKHPEAFGNDHAEHVVKYRDPKKEKTSKSKSGEGKATIKNLRSEFPREEDEERSDWDKRLSEIARERNGQ